MNLDKYVKVFVGISGKNNYNYALIFYDKYNTCLIISDIIVTMENNIKPFILHDKYKMRLNKHIENGKNILCRNPNIKQNFFCIGKYGEYECDYDDNTYISFIIRRSLFSLYRD